MLLSTLMGVPLATSLEARPSVQQPNPEIESVILHGAGEHEEAILKAIRLRPGRVFDNADLRRDQEFLWTRMRVRVETIRAKELENGNIELHLYVAVLPSVSRVVFLGNRVFKREELIEAAGLGAGQSVDEQRAEILAHDVRVFYRDSGYHHAIITPTMDFEQDQVVFEVQEGAKVRVGEVTFLGNHALPSSGFLGMPVGANLSSAIEAGDGWLFIPGSTYEPEMIARDLVALEALYHEFGYLNAQVHLADEVFTSDNRVHLVFQVTEGPLFTVGDVQVESSNGEPLQYSDSTLFEVIGLRAGQPYEAARVTADEGNLRKFYGRKGHPAAARSLTDSESFFAFNPGTGKPKITIRGDDSVVDVTYIIQEGRPMRIRDVVVQGNIRTRDRVIRREISLAPGDLADGEEAIRSWRRLMGKGWFVDPVTGQPFVNWKFVETERPDWVDLEFEIKEGGANGQVLFGGGVNSNTGPFLSISLTKPNFDLFNPPTSWGSAMSEILEGRAFTGGGQNLKMFLAPGTNFSMYSVNFSEPDLLKEHIERTSLNFHAGKTLFYLPSHDETKSSSNLRFGRHFGRHLSVWAGPESNRTTIGGLDGGAPALVVESEGTHRASGIGMGVSWNSIADPFAPIDGSKASFSHRRVGGPFGGDWSLNSTTLLGEKYFPIAKDDYGRSWVVATKGRVQYAHETGGLGGVPFPERFHLGGHGSVRGFDYRGIGPREGGFALGGEATWNTSLELRFPVMSSKVSGAIDEMEYVRGAFWLDAGSVGESLSDFGKTRIAAGFGIRVRIPFMPQLPLSFDFGWPLEQEDWDDTSVFAFSLGKF
ncbi:MAG: BamA/TamA family outer membrane protein [Planctomycetes bacterium]|nr:BamA/TamA family outer membrane protein [Planctomycetota bacterium]